MVITLMKQMRSLKELYMYKPYFMSESAPKIGLQNKDHISTGQIHTIQYFESFIFFFLFYFHIFTLHFFIIQKAVCISEINTCHIKYCFQFFAIASVNQYYVKRNFNLSLSTRIYAEHIYIN